MPARILTSNCPWHGVADVELKVHDVAWLALQLLGQCLEQRRVVWRLRWLLLHCKSTVLDNRAVPLQDPEQ